MFQDRSESGIYTTHQAAEILAAEGFSTELVPGSDGCTELWVTDYGHVADVYVTANDLDEVRGQRIERAVNSPEDLEGRVVRYEVTVWATIGDGGNGWEVWSVEVADESIRLHESEDPDDPAVVIAETTEWPSWG